MRKQAYQVLWLLGDVHWRWCIAELNRIMVSSQNSPYDIFCKIWIVAGHGRDSMAEKWAELFFVDFFVGSHHQGFILRLTGWLAVLICILAKYFVSSSTFRFNIKHFDFGIFSENVQHLVAVVKNLDEWDVLLASPKQKVPSGAHSERVFFWTTVSAWLRTWCKVSLPLWVTC